MTSAVTLWSEQWCALQWMVNLNSGLTELELFGLSFWSQRKTNPNSKMIRQMGGTDNIDDCHIAKSIWPNSWRTAAISKIVFGHNSILADCPISVKLSVAKQLFTKFQQLDKYRVPQNVLLVFLLQFRLQRAVGFITVSDRPTLDYLSCFCVVYWWILKLLTHVRLNLGYINFLVSHTSKSHAN